MKRIISLVLSLIMVLGVCISAPVSLVAYAADNVAENNIVSIEFKPVVPLELMENDCGSWQKETHFDEETGEEVDVKYFEYNFTEIINQKGNVLTVNYKDETSVDYIYNSVVSVSYAEYGYYDSEGNRIYLEYGSNQNYSSQWLPENEYEFYISYSGVKTFVPVSIKESPIKSVEWLKKPDKTEFTRRESLVFNGGVIRVTGKDGSVYDIDLNIGSPKYVDISGYRFNLQGANIFDLEETVGEFTHILSIGGHELTFDYTVTEFNITDITIALDEYKNLYITFHKSNGTNIKAKFLEADFGLGGGNEDYSMLGGYILTDNGVFPGGMYFYSNGEMSVFFYEDVAHSNRIPAKEAFAMFNYADWQTVLVASLYGSTKSFNGKINDKNISDIVRIALYSEQHKPEEFVFSLYSWNGMGAFDPRNTFSYDGDVETAENAIYNTFGIKVDLTDYSIYDKETQKVKIDNTVDRKVVKFPITKKCIDGLWYITAESNGETIEIVVDENRNIKSFKIGEGCSHKSFDWIIDKEATVYKAGSKHKECTECGEVLKTATIPQLKCAKPVLKKVYNANDYVKVTWGTVKGADIYRVYRMVSGGEYEYIGSTSKTYFNDKEAGAGKTCRYRIRAKNEAGYSDYSVSMAIKHIDEPNLIATENTSSGVKITWGNKVTGAQKYNVYRRVSGGEYKYIGSTSDTYYIDETVKSGTKYHYAIRGKRDDSVSSQSESLSKYYLDTPTLNKPSSTTKGIGIKWSQVEGAEGYVVYRRTTDDNYIIVANEKGGSNTDFRDTTTKKGRIYYYRVKAYKSKTYSGNSVTKSVRDEH